MAEREATGRTAPFADPDEFRRVLDRVFTLMSEDPEMGPRLWAAGVPQRFEFPDVGLVVNIRPARPGEDGCLHWEWTDDVDWDPRVAMTMSAEVANAYFQGRENIAMAIARRRIRATGDVRAALDVLPLTKPVFARYREVVETDLPHLLVS